MDPRIKKIVIDDPRNVPGNPYREKMPKGPGGRPKGSKNFHAKNAQVRLQELRYDPIYEMVKQQEQIDKAIEELLYDENGERRTKYSAIAFAQLSAVKMSLINNLMRYGYARTPEGVTVDPDKLKPITINLTNQNYLPGESGAVDAIDLVIAKEVTDKENKESNSMTQ